MDTWWIHNPHLLGSRNPTLADLQQLRRDGFEVLISLLKEDEQSPRYTSHAPRLWVLEKSIAGSEFLIRNRPV